jgi:hypothetical protein
MRTSQSRLGRLALRAGIATTAGAAVVVAGTATPAFAADVALTISPTTGTFGTATSITVTGTGYLASITSPVSRFVSPGTATCPTTLGAVSGTNIAATSTTKGGDDNTATVVAPTTLPAGAYKICVYASSSSTPATPPAPSP